MAAPFGISLGRLWNTRTGRIGRRVTYPHNRHGTIFGPTRSGKGVSLEIPNLLRLGTRKYGGPISIISIDPKGQNAAVTMRWRATVSTVALLDPLDVLRRGSVGFNPLAALDPASPSFFEEASNIAEALIKVDPHGDPFWPESARTLMLALVIWDVKLAYMLTPRRMPSLVNVRAMLTGDLAATARDMVASGDFQLASLAGRFVENNKTNDGIKSTADTATQWVLSAPMAKDLAKNGIDFAALKQRPVTVYVILPPASLQTFSVWLRLVVACALNALYRQGGGGLRTLFLLSEFAQLGRMESVAAALAQGAGYGVQLLPVLQDVNQLREIYGKDAANTFLGMSGFTFAFTPNEAETAELLSKRSGEVSEPGLSASDDPQSGARPSWSEKRRRVLPPDDLYNIPEFHGLVHFAGQSQAVPVYAAPHFDARANPDLVGRYDPDPYHPGSAGGAQRRSRLKDMVMIALLAAAVLIAAHLWLPDRFDIGAHAPGPGAIGRVPPRR